jgi:hypothetical protein
VSLDWSASADLGISLVAPTGVDSDRFLDAHPITDSGVAYSYRLSGGHGQVILFALPAGSAAARGPAGTLTSPSIHVRGHAGTWDLDGNQNILSWSEGGMR